MQKTDAELIAEAEAMRDDDGVVVWLEPISGAAMIIELARRLKAANERCAELEQTLEIEREEQRFAET